MSKLQQDKVENNIEMSVAGIFCSMLLNKGYKVTPHKNLPDNTEVIQIQPSDLLEIVEYLKNQKETLFNLLYSVSGADYTDRMEVIYHLQSVKFVKKLVLKAYLNRNNPEISSLANIFTTANWHERETYDLLGIKFLNHPDLRRILLPDEWKGHPLRKDYVMDDEKLAWNKR